MKAPCFQHTVMILISRKWICEYLIDFINAISVSISGMRSSENFHIIFSTWEDKFQEC
jgi:hypothetical protein